MNQSSAQESTSPAADKTAMGKAAITGYAANVHAFSYYQCRYRYVKAQAKSIEDAIRGKFINAISHDSRLLVDGDKDLYEGLTPPVLPDLKQAVPVAGKKGLFTVPSFVSSDCYLNDGKREMNYCPQLHSVGLWSSDKGSSKIVAHSPLGMHFVGHRNRRGPDVLVSQSDRYEMFSDGMQEIDGQPLITVRFKDRVTYPAQEGPLTSTYLFSFDIGKGHLPIRMALLWNDKPKIQVFVTDVRECSNQRWFPERSVMVVIPDKANTLFDVSELKLLELDADHHPAAGDFVFTIPAGTSVVDQNNGRRFFKLKQQETIRLEDLPKLFAMLDQVQQNPLTDTAIPHTGPYRWVWVGGGIALTLGGMAFLILRRLRIKRLAT
jgi:hypothetical protein